MRCRGAFPGCLPLPVVPASASVSLSVSAQVSRCFPPALWESFCPHVSVLPSCVWPLLIPLSIDRLSLSLPLTPVSSSPSGGGSSLWVFLALPTHPCPQNSCPPEALWGSGVRSPFSPLLPSLRSSLWPAGDGVAGAGGSVWFPSAPHSCPERGASLPVWVPLWISPTFCTPQEKLQKALPGVGAQAPSQSSTGPRPLPSCLPALRVSQAAGEGRAGPGPGHACLPLQPCPRPPCGWERRARPLGAPGGTVPSSQNPSSVPVRSRTQETSACLGPSGMHAFSHSVTQSRRESSG